ncbi:MAG: 50S ribosomal protein L21 [bacterium]
MLAVIKTGGKQHVVREKEIIKVEKLALEVGAKVSFDAMLVANEDGAGFKVGSPIVKGAKVEAKVLEHDRTAKITVGKYKNKTRYRRFNTHRQPFTKIEIEKISA